MEDEGADLGASSSRGCGARPQYFRYADANPEADAEGLDVHVRGILINLLSKPPSLISPPPGEGRYPGQDRFREDRRALGDPDLGHLGHHRRRLRVRQAAQVDHQAARHRGSQRRQALRLRVSGDRSAELAAGLGQGSRQHGRGQQREYGPEHLRHSPAFTRKRAIIDSPTGSGT